jgi:hypothetical protein
MKSDDLILIYSALILLLRVLASVGSGSVAVTIARSRIRDFSYDGIKKSTVPAAIRIVVRRTKTQIDAAIRGSMRKKGHIIFSASVDRDGFSGDERRKCLRDRGGGIRFEEDIKSGRARGHLSQSR